MNHWLLMFKPDTYEVVKERGLIGVKYQNRRVFRTIREGDTFVAYVSRKRVVDGHGVFTSDPFQDASEVWPTFERYPERCHVRFHQTDAGVDAKELLWHLGCWPQPMKTTPSNYLFCKGGFMAINIKDRARLLDALP